MTKTEAIAAMERGEKVRHVNFLPDEYIHLSEGTILTEDGYDISPRLFNCLHPDTGWSIYHPETGALAD